MHTFKSGFRGAPLLLAAKDTFGTAWDHGNVGFRPMALNIAAEKHMKSG